MNERKTFDEIDVGYIEPKTHHDDRVIKAAFEVAQVYMSKNSTSVQRGDKIYWLKVAAMNHPDYKGE